MSAAVNKAFVIGNVGKDIELRYTNSGTAVATVSVATNERVKKAGEWTDHTEWHNIVVWGRMAENCGKYLRKGSQVFVEGRLRTRQWQDRDGANRYTTEIVADNVQFLSGGDRDGSHQRPAATSAAPRQPQQPTQQGLGYNDSSNNNQPADYSDDDVPF